jgi:long-chain acyl-CoA synthetase
MAPNWRHFNGIYRFEVLNAIDQILKFNKNYFFASKSIEAKEIVLIQKTLEENFNQDLGLLAFLTSGSSGNSKIVVHSIDTLITSAKKIVLAYPNLKGKRFHHLFPVTYMAGVLNSILVPLVAEGSLIFDEEFTFASQITLNEKITKYEPEILWLSPGMLASVVALGKRFKNKSNKLNLVLNATGPLGSETRDRASDILGCEILSTYGSSELLFISGERTAAEKVSIGVPFESVDIKLKPMGSKISPAKSLEIWVSTNTKPVAVYSFSKSNSGYKSDPIYSGIEFPTKDLAINDGGLIRIVGRNDDIVVLGGVNISLSKIEEFANSVSGVVDSCARAQFEGSFSSLELLYELDIGQNAFSENDLVTRLKLLGNEHIPRKLKRVKFIRTHSGKINRNHIRNSDNGYVII